jgi:hypothetical protein
MDIETEIADVANQRRLWFVTDRFRKSIFEGTILGKVISFTPESSIQIVWLISLQEKRACENSPFDEKNQTDYF